MPHDLAPERPAPAPDRLAEPAAGRAVDAAVDAALDPAVLDEVLGTFAERIASGRAPGSAVAVFDRTGVIAARGFGTSELGPEGGAAPTSMTAFRIASCTKSFTAAALLVLRDRGRLDLDAPITDAVPGFRFVHGPAGSTAVPTVRMLATMSGGLPTDDPWADRQESLTAAEFDAVLAAGVRAASIPGTEYEYSNLGYALLGRVVEHAAGMPYRTFVERELLAPLGLTGTGFSVDAVPGPLATGYRRSRDAWLPLPFSGPGAFSPIGGLFSTVDDLARWGAWLADAFTDDPATDAGPLPRASRREMQQMHRFQRPSGARRADPAAWAGTVTGYGFGLNVREDAVHGTVVHHSGGYPGFSANMRWHPASGLGVVAFENATYAGVGIGVAAALDRLIEHVSGVDAESARIPRPSSSGRSPRIETPSSPEQRVSIRPLRGLLDGRVAPWPPVTPWPDTLALAARAQRLLAGWNDAEAEAIFTPNVALDVPYEERAEQIRTLLAEVGTIASLDEPKGESDSPAHLSWRVPAARGALRCDILLAPIAEPRIQRFRVERATD